MCWVFWYCPELYCVLPIYYLHLPASSGVTTFLATYRTRFIHVHLIICTYNYVHVYVYNYIYVYDHIYATCSFMLPWCMMLLWYPYCTWYTAYIYSTYIATTIHIPPPIPQPHHRYHTHNGGKGLAIGAIYDPLPSLGWWEGCLNQIFL